MQFLRVAVAISLSAAVGGGARAEWFSINDAISQAVLTNPGVGEASANRRATESELRQTQGGEVNAIVPACVVVGNDGSPACEPAGSPPRAASPASNTIVSARPGAGITMLLGRESPIAIVSSAVDCEPSAS